MPIKLYAMFLSGELKMILKIIFINSCVQRILLSIYYASETISEYLIINVHANYKY